MKRSFIIIVFITSFIWSCNNKTSDEDVTLNLKDSTTVKFEESKYDFGDITQGEVIKHTFYFKNTGDKPLIISEVRTSCGCTVADYSTKPLGPGEKGYIAATFNSSGKSGEQYKNIIVIMNTSPKKNILQLTGFVKTENN